MNFSHFPDVSGNCLEFFNIAISDNANQKNTNNTPLLRNGVSLRTCYVHSTKVAFAEKNENVAREMFSMAGREFDSYTQMYNQILCLCRVIAENQESLTLVSHLISWYPSILRAIWPQVWYSQQLDTVRSISVHYFILWKFRCKRSPMSNIWKLQAYIIECHRY